MGGSFIFLGYIWTTYTVYHKYKTYPVLCVDEGKKALDGFLIVTPITWFIPKELRFTEYCISSVKTPSHMPGDRYHTICFHFSFGMYKAVYYHSSD